ncbi:MAG TPA: L,D-transpeptidase family protein [Candidatus Sulfomarinibacteraceae bacterium]|nr:L,D-transpeptidase family protein [Candidatus Sulfomarinibacteraceae bacterium]
MRRTRRLQWWIVGVALALLAAVQGAEEAWAQSRTPDRPRRASLHVERPPAVVEGGPCEETLRVRPGQTLGGIALMCRTTVADLMELNPEIENPNIIHVGQELRIPEHDGPPIYTTRVTVPRAEALPDGVGPDERWIDVDLDEQMLVAYEGHEPVFQSLVSSGLPQYPTVVGTFRVERRYELKDMDGRPLGFDYFLRDVPYQMFFYRAYAIHGTYWHGNYGTRMSHGCVNVPTPAAEWLFEWSEMGTVVRVRG